MLKMWLTILMAACTASCAAATGRYQLPYMYNTEVVVTADPRNHANPPQDMYDMRASGPVGLIAAAADGWVRFIEDGCTKKNSGPNNYVWIEHPYPFCQDPDDRMRATWPGKPIDYDRTCTPCEDTFCNEWSVYAHMATDSVTNGGNIIYKELRVGDWVTAGQIIAVEGEIGSVDARSLHWHVAVIDPTVEPDQDGYYSDWAKEPDFTDPEVVPLVCHRDGATYLLEGRTYYAAPCQ